MSGWQGMTINPFMGSGEEIEILEGDNEIAEAEIVAQKILELTDGGYRHGETDYHLQKTTDGTADYGGVEVFKGAWRVTQVLLRKHKHASHP
jgi:hypothetical protein